MFGALGVWGLYSHRGRDKLSERLYPLPTVVSSYSYYNVQEEDMKCLTDIGFFFLD